MGGYVRPGPERSEKGDYLLKRRECGTGTVTLFKPAGNPTARNARDVSPAGGTAKTRIARCRGNNQQ